MDYDPVHPIQQQHEDGEELTQLGANLAVQACSACKKQKRKCDKALPACSLCQRIGEYIDLA